MLAGWQIGDVELMHKMYAENVVVVSGMFEPPIVGWAAYSQAYKRQRDRIQSPRLERFNTLTTVRGNVAWVAYQWAFTAVEGTQQIAARGHTSLVLEKQGGKWLIVHNHTSVVPEQLTPPAQTPAQPPPKPGR
jgi:ketosteroid isomerase-like protein